MSWSEDTCYILKQHGIYYSQTGVSITFDGVTVDDKSIADICLGCSLTACVYDKKKKAKQMSFCQGISLKPRLQLL